MKNFYWPFLLWVWCLLAALLLAGCGQWPAPKPKSPSEPSKNECSPVQQALNPGLEKLVILGVIATGAGLGLFFLAPTAHRLSTMILGVGAGVGSLALVLRISLPAITYGVYISLGLGALFLVYELYRKVRKAP